MTLAVPPLSYPSITITLIVPLSWQIASCGGVAMARESAGSVQETRAGSSMIVATVTLDNRLCSPQRNDRIEGSQNLAVRRDHVT